MLQKVYDEFTHGQEKSEGEGTSTLNNIKRVQRSGERCKTIISKRVQDFYIYWSNQN